MRAILLALRQVRTDVQRAIGELDSLASVSSISKSAAGKIATAIEAISVVVSREST